MEHLPNSLESLGLSQLLHSLARRAKISSTAHMVLSLSPFQNWEDLQNDWQNLAEYVQLSQTGLSFAASELAEIDELFKKLDIEGNILSPDEALLFRRLLSLIESNMPLFHFVQNHQEEYPHLYSIATGIEDLPEVRRHFDSILNPEGEILDNASQELLQIREKKHTLRKTIQQRLEDFISDEKVREFLQDQFVTVKEGRFVLPIKISLKSLFQKEYHAILHTYSKSGETVYMEPAFIVDANNEILEIEERETQELWHLMESITDSIREHRLVLKIAYEALPSWEWLHIRFTYWKEIHGVLPTLSKKPVLRIQGARHPFLGERAIPIDIILEEYQALIISGPNAGGKTVALKTAGLLTFMTLCGIPIPATEATVGFFTTIYAEIGDEQSIEKQLSSFTGHIATLQAIWQHASPSSLVLIDEIANNTDPREGEALAKAYIEAILNKQAMLILTTHYNGLKQLAYHDQRVQNASVLFDTEKLVPLYRIHYGESSMSFALDIARQHGLEKSIINQAERYLKESLTPTEKLLQEIEKQKQLLATKQQKLEKRLAEVFQMELSYKKKLKELEAKEKTYKEKHLAKLSEELQSIKEEIQHLRQSLKNKSLSPVQLESLASAVEKRLQSEQKKLHTPLENPTVGQQVFLPSFQTTGTIEVIQRDKVKVRVGGVSLIVSKNELYESSSPPPPPPPPVSRSPLPTGGSLVVDVRGQTVSEAIRTLERLIDKALVEGKTTIAVIHGIGEGILQRAIHDFLREQSAVEKYEFAPPHEGGRGKTIITLK